MDIKEYSMPDKQTPIESKPLTMQWLKTKLSIAKDLEIHSTERGITLSAARQAGRAAAFQEIIAHLENQNDQIRPTTP